MGNAKSLKILKLICAICMPESPIRIYLFPEPIAMLHRSRAQSLIKKFVVFAIIVVIHGSMKVLRSA